MSRTFNALAVLIISALVALNVYQNRVIEQQRTEIVKVAETFCGKFI